MPVKTGFKMLCGLGAVLSAMTSCGPLPDMSTYSGSAPVRRVFVNDVARNDSLIAAIARPVGDSGGLLFVLQPGQTYHLRLATSSFSAGDQLSLSGYIGGGLIPFGNLPDSSVNDTEIFTLESTQSQATYFQGLLQATDGTKAAQRIQHVSLVSLNATPVSDTLSVNLIMVGDLSNAGLPDSAHKAAFAAAFAAELDSIYAGSFTPAITFAWTSSIASPNLSPVTLVFGNTFVPLPGARVGNAANLYLIDSISYANLLPGEEILGFSPREVVDLSTDEDSRVILSARGAVTAGGSSIMAGIPSLATTTAHELGHFFGLRHPTATTVDLENDDDQTNKDDGFNSTPVCANLTKSGEHIVTAKYNKRQYCLYVADQGCLAGCDVDNLMFAYSCGSPQAQRNLTGEQQAFFRKNLALLQGK